MGHYYISTPIYYVNDQPHLGHAYCTLAADAAARYQRMAGNKVHFLTGTDEHGQKVEKSAAKQGITPRQLADKVVKRYQDLWERLDISHDDFIRTTEERHRKTVEVLFKKMLDKGDIYKDEYEGWYCSGCEAFIAESQVKDQKCPDFGHPVERLKEESYFFKLSAYTDKLLALYKDQPDFIQPDNRRNEVVRFVEEGLRDLSISRTSISWGIPVPGDEKHVIYVWLDALSNYVSALGYGRDDASLYDEFWPANVHLIGKDILRFHAVYWPAFLMSAELPLPKQVFGHGWWLKDEQKMSKSLGNIVDPWPLMDTLGVDTLRYFLLREVPFGQDGSFSDEAIIDRLNGDLANGIGNLYARVTRLMETACGGQIPERADNPQLQAAAEKVFAPYRQAMEKLAFRDALSSVWSLIGEVDKFLVQEEPWKAVKDPQRKDGVPAVLYAAGEVLRLCAMMAQPVMPKACGSILTTLTGSEEHSLEELKWGGLEPGRPIAKGAPLFPRVDKNKYFADMAKEKTVTETTENKPAEKAPEKKAEAAEPKNDQITFDTFGKVQLKVGTVMTCEKIEKSRKLLRLEVDLGEEEHRQIVAGIAEKYSPEDLTGKQVIVVANLKPAKLMGVESRGMLLAATVDGLPVVASFGETVANGTPVK